MSDFVGTCTECGHLHHLGDGRYEECPVCGFDGGDPCRMNPWNADPDCTVCNPEPDPAGRAYVSWAEEAAEYARTQALQPAEDEVI